MFLHKKIKDKKKKIFFKKRVFFETTIPLRGVVPWLQ
jgi:hypothetical protein